MGLPDLAVFGRALMPQVTVRQGIAVHRKRALNAPSVSPMHLGTLTVLGTPTVLPVRWTLRPGCDQPPCTPRHVWSCTCPWCNTNPIRIASARKVCPGE